MATVESSLAPILEPTPEIEAAWERFRTARASWDDAARKHGSISLECRAVMDAMVEAGMELERVIPMRSGFYRLDDRLVGFAKVSKCGLTLVNKASAWSLDHPEGVRWRERQELVGRILSRRNHV